MKYHYQYVSKTSVRIEIIPENKKESNLIEVLSLADDQRITEIFQKALESYDRGSVLTSTKFMNFPKVALCSHIKDL